MPLRPPKRHISDAENKLRLLCCARALGMATQEQLWPFVARLELMDYVPYCLYLDELKKDGSLAVGQHALKGMLYLTDEGERALRLFGGRVTPADRERIQAEAPKYAAGLNERRQARAAYERCDEGKLCVRCEVREDDAPLMVIRLRTADEALAQQAARRFRERAPKLITLLYTLPFEPRGDALPMAATPQDALMLAEEGTPAICACGKRYIAAIRAEDERAVYGVSLLLPGREAAQGWALAASRAALAGQMSRALEENVE